MTPPLDAEALKVSDLSDPAYFSVEHLLGSRLSVGLTLEDWPRPIRIYALGRFAVVKDGAPIAFAGRPQHKPMTLLKAVVALGSGDVDSQDVMAALWPVADGDAARNAFDVALHRLRNLAPNSGCLPLALSTDMLTHAKRGSLRAAVIGDSQYLNRDGNAAVACWRKASACPRLTVGNPSRKR